MKFPETAEYDSACFPDHKKLYFSPSKNQLLRSKLFREKLMRKKFL